MVSKTAKIFKSGNSQAVRIPKEFQLEYLRHKCQGVLSFFTAAAENHKVVRVSHMAPLPGLERLVRSSRTRLLSHGEMTPP